MSTPISAIASTTFGSISSAGCGTRGADVHTAPAESSSSQRGGHLAAPGIVDADEQHLGLLLLDLTLRLRECA